MADLEKVLKGLEKFVSDFKPYCGNESDWQRVFDALALLKAQEPVNYIFDFDGDLICGGCGEQIDGTDNYCRTCGRKVKWE